MSSMVHGSVTPFMKAPPGYGLTITPGSQPWERPPEYTTPDQAMEYLESKLLPAENAAKIMAVYDMGMDAHTIASTILFREFTKGRWNVDLAYMLYPPLMMLLTAIGSHNDTFQLFPDMDEDPEDADFYKALAARGGDKIPAELIEKTGEQIQAAQDSGQIDEMSNSLMPPMTPENGETAPQEGAEPQQEPMSQEGLMPKMEQ